MRNLREFSWHEWLQLLPAQHAFKQARNDTLLSLYNRARTRHLDEFLRVNAALANCDVVVVIAFERPWAINWLLEMAKPHLTDTTVMVFDNSRQASSRREIEWVCKGHNTPYLALPANPTRHANRSHGMAMQWVFENVIRALQPRVFAFIDHDLIPIRKISFAQRLGDQPFFGLLWTSRRNATWQLWAGYCVFDYKAVGQLPLNFLYDFSQGLDTGGRNWRALYSQHERDKLHFATETNIEARAPTMGESRSLQIIDDAWFHIGGIGYNDNFNAKFQFCEQLASSLNGGVPWSQACALSRSK